MHLDFRVVRVLGQTTRETMTGLIRKTERKTKYDLRTYRKYSLDIDTTVRWEDMRVSYLKRFVTFLIVATLLAVLVNFLYKANLGGYSQTEKFVIYIAVALLLAGLAYYITKTRAYLNKINEGLNAFLVPIYGNDIEWYVVEELIGKQSVIGSGRKPREPSESIGKPVFDIVDESFWQQFVDSLEPTA